MGGFRVRVTLGRNIEEADSVAMAVVTDPNTSWRKRKTLTCGTRLPAAQGERGEDVGDSGLRLGRARALRLRRSEAAQSRMRERESRAGQRKQRAD